MPDSLLQFVLQLLGHIQFPVVLGSRLGRYLPASVDRLIAEGVLRETSIAEEIPRPARYGHGADLLVRKTAIGLFGVSDGEYYCDPVPLAEDDVRQYAISSRGLVEKLRKENGISGNGFDPNDGIVVVGEKSVVGIGVFDVCLYCPNRDLHGLLGRLWRPDPRDRAVVVITPTPILATTQNRRMLTDNRILLAALLPLAEADDLTLDWDLIAGCQPADRKPILVPPATGKKQMRTAGSPEAVEAVKIYLDAKVMDLTQFAIQSQMTDRTLRRFLKVGELQRSNFKTMAEGMGLTAEQLLAGVLPDSIKYRQPR